MSKFVWFDHRSENPDGASTFYEDLLGWQRADKGPPRMTAYAEGAERPWAGMTQTEGVPSGWLPYVQVEDLSEATRKATKLGGEVLKDRMKGPAGDFAVIRDPAGGTVALWQAG